MKINIEQINKELWEICTDFKEETDAKNDYIDYISALLYLIYDKNDELEQLKYFYNIRYEDSIVETIEKNIEMLQDKNLFRNIKFKNIIMYRNIWKYNALSKTIAAIYKLIMELENEYGESKKYIAKAYEYIVIQVMAKGDINIQNAQMYTPKGITKVMIGCLDIKEEAQVQDPSCGTGNFILNMPHNKKIKIYAKEENRQSYNICKTNLLLHDIDSENIEFNDFKEKTYIKTKFDNVVSNPTFVQRGIKTKIVRNQKIEYEYGYANKKLAPGEYSYVLKMFEDLKDDGKMAVIMPHGALFREKEKMVRKELIEGNYIDAIIGLPENMFFGTRISVTIMILAKKKNKEGILFIDASNEYKSKKKINIFTQENQQRIIEAYKKRENIKGYAYLSTKNEIANNDYNLTIKKYVKEEINKPKVDIQITIKKLTQLEQERNNIEEHITDILEKMYIKLGSTKEKKLEQETDSENVLYLKYHGERCAKGIWNNKEFTILKGSKTVNEISKSISKSLVNAVEEARSKENVNSGVFIKDYKCKSPSMAATIILGINTNGRKAWKNKDGKTIKELEETQIVEKYLS